VGEKPPLAEVGSSSAVSTGVSATPTRLDSDALHSAAGTLPRAIEVKAIEDCTVDGSTQRKSRPTAISGATKPPMV
jgi:hypothetical protein